MGCRHLRTGLLTESLLVLRIKTNTSQYFFLGKDYWCRLPFNIHLLHTSVILVWAAARGRLGQWFIREQDTLMEQVIQMENHCAN